MTQAMHKRLDAALDRVCRPLNVFGSSLSMFMALMATAHVLSRFFFDLPLMGTVASEQSMLALLVFCALPFAYRSKRLVAVDFVTAYLHRQTKMIVDATTVAVATLFFALGVVFTFTQALTAYASDAALVPVPFIPQWPFFFLLAASFVLVTLSALAESLAHFDACVQEGLFGRTLSAIVAVNGTIVAIIFLFSSGYELDMEIMNLLLIPLLFLFLFSGLLIGAALGLLGYLAMGLVFGDMPAAGLFKTVPLAQASSYELCVMPFFILMGELCFQSGMSERLYIAAHKWMGHAKGGLCMATIVACAAFSAVSGSSLATAATMSSVALPEMRRYGYKDTIATGAVAVGGGLGILIPPSTILIIYGILVEAPIAELFFAGVLPGILSVIYYLITIKIMVTLFPGIAPASPKAPMKEKVRSLSGAWEVVVLFLFIMGGIYGGYFTPTEAGAMGVAMILAIGFFRKNLNREKVTRALLSTGETTVMALFIVIGTAMFGIYLTSSQMPGDLAAWVHGLDVPPFAVVIAMLLICGFLGCLMGTLPLVFITVPIFAPIVTALGYDLIWFGIVMVIISEIGLITPPVGMNVFIIKGIAKDVPLGTIFRGIIPFLFADIARLATIVAFPQISLFLPSLLRGAG